MVSAERRAGDRRVRRVSFRYPERRSGFDRRDAGGSPTHRLLERLRDDPLLVAGILVLIVGLQAADVALTAILLQGGATEINPVMAGLFEAGTPAAAAFKAAVTALLVAGIWRLRRFRRILEFGIVLVVGLVAVIGYQVALILGS